ncbi:MAG: DUF1343 domain-containing protein [Rubricoccaceae bacterium]|nr:DUF1343 domain-containing protein [Rubricoccaceae bacterium]
MHVVRTGAQVLVDGNFDQLAGWNVGLVINHTALVDTSDGGPVHLIDRIDKASTVTLGAIFGPEHGYRGTAEAGDHVTGGRDEATGVPVYSLHGDRRKPTQAQLRGLDALVFDIQDVGARFYTYISTMGLAMQAAAEAGIPFIVLDRPNPISDRVEGFLMEPEHASFVGQYAIPQTHGMTVGELARMIQGEGLLGGLENLDLRVIAMEHYNRNMLWADTGLEWIAPSPNIPDAATALAYAGSALFENSAVNEGRGTRTPFQVVGAPWADGHALELELNSRDLPGVTFQAVRYTPESIQGMASNPTHRDREVRGVLIKANDPYAFQPVATGIHLLHAFYHQAPTAARSDFFNADWLAKLSGTDLLRRMLVDGASPEEIILAWSDDVESFKRQREPYLLYE